MQFWALAYGVTTIFQQRPVAVIFWENSFYSIPASTFNKNEFDNNDWQSVIQKGLSFIYAEKPKTADGLKQLLANIQEHKLAPHHQIDLYKPLKPYFAYLIPYQLDISEIIEKNAKIKLDIERFLVKTKTNLKDHIYFPLYSKYQNSILIFDHNGNLKSYVTVPPRER